MIIYNEVIETLRLERSEAQSKDIFRVHFDCDATTASPLSAR